MEYQIPPFSNGLEVVASTSDFFLQRIGSESGHVDFYLKPAGYRVRVTLFEGDFSLSRMNGVGGEVNLLCKGVDIDLAFRLLPIVLLDAEEGPWPCIEKEFKACGSFHDSSCRKWNVSVNSGGGYDLKPLSGPEAFYRIPVWLLERLKQHFQGDALGLLYSLSDLKTGEIK